MTEHGDNDNPNHEENSIEFPNIHGRKNPATHSKSLKASEGETNSHE